MVPTPKADCSSITRGPEDSDTPLFSVVCEDWISERTGEWKGNTEAKNRKAVRLFLDVNGDKPIAAYNKSDGRHFKQTIRALPKDWSRNSAYEQMSVTEIVEKA